MTKSARVEQSHANNVELLEPRLLLNADLAPLTDPVASSAIVAVDALDTSDLADDPYASSSAQMAARQWSPLFAQTIETSDANTLTLADLDTFSNGFISDREPDSPPLRLEQPGRLTIDSSETNAQPLVRTNDAGISGRIGQVKDAIKSDPESVSQPAHAQALGWRAVDSASADPANTPGMSNRPETGAEKIDLITIDLGITDPERAGTTNAGPAITPETTTHDGVNPEAITTSASKPLTLAELDALAGLISDDEAKTDIRPAIREVLIIDESVADYQTIVADFLSSAADGVSRFAHVLDRQRPGLPQISEWLSGYRNISALHLVTHGVEGGIAAGSSLVETSTLEQHHGLVEAWASALGEDARDGE